jgi:hypothetical protein
MDLVCLLRIHKELIVVEFKVLHRHFLRVEENHEKLQSGCLVSEPRFGPSEY